MRNKELLETLRTKYSSQYDFLMEKIRETNVRGERCFFLGFRDQYLNLYYKGMSVAKIEENGDEIQYSMDDYYLEGLNKKEPLSFEQFQKDEVFSNILKQIENHVTGKHGVKHRNQREKVCQQWIVNMNNTFGREWFFVDMEYVCDKDPYGRPDLIAVKRTPNENGKHTVALIELKVGYGSYKGLTRESFAKKQREYEIIAKDLYDDRKEVKELKFGSGIVSHLADYLRFLNNENNDLSQMREEIVSMIQGNQLLGLISEEDDLAKITKKSQLEDKPVIYILTYSYTPYHPGDKEKKKKMKSMKQSFYNFIYGNGTPFGLKNLLNHSQISGLLSDEEGFRNAICDDSVTRFERKQTVNEKEYQFIFCFKDPDDPAKEPWDCL